MPKMPEVTVHVTAEPDPKETQEYKASADMWAEQCRTLQRTLLDTQIEREALRVRLKHAQHGLGEGITRPHDAPEGCPTYYDGCNCTVEALAHNIDRAEKAERRVAELERENHRLDAIVHGQDSHAIQEAWQRLGSAPDPLDPGFYVCNSIDIDRWEALRRALFNEAE